MRRDGLRAIVSGRCQQNVIFTLIDIVRWDTFGFERPVLPSRYLREFAEHSAFFPNAIAPDTYTPTSHAAILTGRDAIYHATLGPRKLYYGVADFLNYNGYETLLLADNPYLNGLIPYFSGFEGVQLLKDQTAIDDPRALKFYPREEAGHGYGTPVERNIEANIPDWERLFDRFREADFNGLKWVDIDAHFDVAAYVDWRYDELFKHLQDREERPIFCFFNLMGYVLWVRDKRGIASWWTEFFRRNFDGPPERRELELLCRDFEDSGLYVRDKKLHAPVAFGEVSKSLYLACSGAIHRQLMVKLKRLGILTSRSINILSTDHGHMWREHGEKFIEHGPTNNVYQQMLRSPLFVQTPALCHGIYPQHVVLTDILPSLNKWIETFAPIPKECFNPYYAMPLEERISNNLPIAFATEAGSMVAFEKNYKAVFNQKAGKNSYVFDLENDSAENRNLYAILQSEHLVRYREIFEDYFLKEAACVESLVPLASQQEFVDMPNETMNALRALGYLE